MKKFSELISSRRSIRRFTADPLKSEQVELILKAGLKSPSSKNSKSYQFIVLEDKEMLQKLANSKKVGSKPLSECSLAIVVIADPLVSDVWIEDASIATIVMQLQAEDLGLGSCWIQIRERFTATGVSSGEFVKELLGIPLHMQVISILAIGNKGQQKLPIDDEKLCWEKVHLEKY